MNIEWLEIIKQTFLVSGFVLFMMLIIEYINVRTKENWSKPLQKSRWLQLIVAVVLGVTPGCAGIFATVSLFTHNIINFAALLGGTIAAVGDEAFIMLTLIPSTALKILLLTSFIGIISGILFNLFFKSKPLPKFEKHLQVHGDDCCAKGPHEHHTHVHEKKYGFTFARSMFLSILILIIFSQFAQFNTSHTSVPQESLFSPEAIIFMFMGLVSMFIIITVPEHFLMEHLWGHVIKKHFLRLFLWTLGALILIAVFSEYFQIGAWVKVNQVFVLIIAVAIGLLPTSGPHIIFITLFMQGMIPFSFLLANSVVQDGHGGIPLLAEDRASFFKLKAIKFFIGLLVGFLGIYFKF
jgi:hypothetical protein